MMAGENFIILPDSTIKHDKTVKGISPVKTGAVTILFVAGMALSNPFDTGENVSLYNYTAPSYIQCINLNQTRELYNVDNSISINISKRINLDKIEKMSFFKEDWNGTGGKAFSSTAIAFFESVIEKLEQQPEVAPTGRNSLLMQYELKDKSLLAFEVGENRAEKVYIPQGDYSRAETAIFTDNVCERIKESVEQFYGYKAY